MMTNLFRWLTIGILVLPLVVSPARGDSWMVYPTNQNNCTGYTDYMDKHDGQILVYGGATSGTVRKENGYLKFDTSVIPPGTAVTAIVWNFYVSDTSWPYWSVTPMSADSAALAGTPPLVWEDLEAERDAGYYNFQNEESTYSLGWKTLALGGTATGDLSALLASGQDWFAFGGVSRDNFTDYYIEIDGHNGPNVPYLIVFDDPLSANDTCADALMVPGATGSYSYSGDTTFANDDYNCNATCVGGLPHGEMDVAYAITLPAGCEACVSLNQSEMLWNGGVYMVSDCADVDGTCVAGASGWLAGSEDETFCYRTEATATYYIIVDGRTNGGFGPFQLDVSVSCLAGPSNLVCTETPQGVDLAWTNNDNYDFIEVFVDGDLVQTVPGTTTAVMVIPPDIGYRCFYLCAYADADSVCSEDCCLIYGYNWENLVWDFEQDDGGFVVEGTGLWEWGEATYGPCSETAFGKLWATALHQEYHPNACWLLDSPPIELGHLGAFLSFDHCYDSEFGYDGGVVWFTTDDFWYYTSEPMKGTDGVISATPACTWVAGQKGFTGTSGGWVTDHWDLTDPMWQNEMVKLRFAFGSDDLISAPGWMIDNITVYSHQTFMTIDCEYTVTPLSGTVPFQTVHQITLTNVQLWTRRIAGQIAVTIGNGTYISPWKAGYTNVSPGSSYTTQFPVNIPALGTVIGSNIFALSAEDVTPAPYNQPPYPPSGDLCSKTNVVLANVP